MILPVTSQQAEALMALAGVRPPVRYVVIGATALGAYLRLPRPTADIDLALVADVADVAAIVHRLGWRGSPDNPLRWRCGSQVVVDIIPASREALAAGQLVPLDESRVMSLEGFELAFRCVQPVRLPGSDTSVLVPTLPVLVYLKMIAWLDRPHERVRDLGDILHALDAALPDDDARRWDRTHPVGAADLEYQDQSAYFLGHELGALLTTAQRDRAGTLVADLTDPDGPWRLRAAREARWLHDGAEEAAGRRLEAFWRGLAAAPAPPATGPTR